MKLAKRCFATVRNVQPASDAIEMGSGTRRAAVGVLYCVRGTRSSHMWVAYLGYMYRTLARQRALKG